LPKLQYLRSVITTPKLVHGDMLLLLGLSWISTEKKWARSNQVQVQLEDCFCVS
jgi:hypothetical protein